eukprot:SAG11_NODE_372_length_10036_cov_8.820871_6_plen_126_part_00
MAKWQQNLKLILFGGLHKNHKSNSTLKIINSEFVPGSIKSFKCNARLITLITGSSKTGLVITAAIDLQDTVKRDSPTQTGNYAIAICSFLELFTNHHGLDLVSRRSPVTEPSKNDLRLAELLLKI